jgi:hypothetical protein
MMLFLRDQAPGAMRAFSRIGVKKLALAVAGRALSHRQITILVPQSDRLQ